MGSMSIWHWLIVLAVVVIVFGGGGKLSGLMGDFGRGIKSFKRNLEDDESMEQSAKGDGRIAAPSQKDASFTADSGAARTTTTSGGTHTS